MNSYDETEPKKTPINDMGDYIDHLMDSIYKTIPDSFFEFFSKYLLTNNTTFISQVESGSDISLTVSDYVMNSLYSIFNAITKDTTIFAPDDVKPAVDKIIRNRFNKRQYLFKSTGQKISSLAVTDKKNPANQKYISIMSLPQDELLNLRKNYSVVNTIDDIVKMHALSDMEIWYNSSAPFSDFPFLLQYSSSKIEKYINFDMEFFVANYIKTRLNYNLDSYLHVYPEELIEFPAFSQNTLLVPAVTFDSIPSAGGDPLYYLIPSTQDTSVKTVHSLTTTEFIVLDAIVRNLSYHIYDEKEPTLTIERDELLRSLRFSSVADKDHEKNLKSIKYALDASLNRLLSTELAYLKNNSYSRMQFIDNMTYNFETKTYTIQLGTAYRNLLINGRLIRITDSDLKKLNDNLSRYVMFVIQRRRIEKCLEGDMADDLDYKFISGRIVFQSNHYKISDFEATKHMDAVFNVLEGFKQAGVCISELSRTENLVIHVEYIPLSAADKNILKLPSFDTADDNL